MFKLNIYCKIICYIIFCISIILLNVPLGFLTLIIFGLALSIIKKSNISVIAFLISILIFIPYSIYPFLKIIVKLCLIICYYLFLKDRITKDEQRYLYTKMAYCSKGKKAIITYLKNYYYKDIKNNNYSKIENIDCNNTEYKKLIKNVALKTNKEMDIIYQTTQTRFFKYYNTRTNLIKIKWQKYDIFALLISILALMIIIKG